MSTWVYVQLFVVYELRVTISVLRFLFVFDALQRLHDRSFSLAGDFRMQRRQAPERDRKEADHSHAHAYAHSGLHEFSGEYFVDEGASTATRLIAVAVIVILLLLAFIAYRLLYK